MYVSIRSYRVDPQVSSEVVRLISEEFAPLIEGARGIAEYYVVEGRGGRIAGISICEDEAAVEQTNKLAGQWIKQYVTERVFSQEQLTKFYLEVDEPLYGPVHRILPKPDSEEDQQRGAGELFREKDLGQTDDQDPQLLSVQEVSEVLGMGKGWVYREIRSGRIPSIKLGGSVKVSRGDLEAYLNKNRYQEAQSEE